MHLTPQEGHIFIYDLKKMNGMSGRDYNGERLQLTPGLCLFYLNPENKMMPIAIQVYHWLSNLFLKNNSNNIIEMHILELRLNLKFHLSFLNIHKIMRAISHWEMHFYYRIHNSYCYS